MEKTLESPLDSKEIKPVNCIENQPWIFIRRTDAKAKTPILWSPDVKSWLTGKDADAGKDWGQEENGTTEDEDVGWHHQLNGHEFEQTQGDSEGQGSLECCSPWGSRVGHNLATEHHHHMWTALAEEYAAASLPGGMLQSHLSCTAAQKWIWAFYSNNQGADPLHLRIVTTTEQRGGPAQTCSAGSGHYNTHHISNKVHNGQHTVRKRLQASTSKTNLPPKTY